MRVLIPTTWKHGTKNFNPSNAMKIKSPIHRSIASRRDRGFTLVELLLVLAILAVLAGIIYPKLANRMVGARITATATQIKAFSTALEIFEVDNGNYPKGPNGLLDLVQRPHDAANWHGPYLEAIPKDPWGNAYTYAFPGKFHPAGYDIISAGPDAQLGTPDDIMNLQSAK
jgi:general secretion pathway protein G